jgi:hypothetical protein
MFLRVPLCPLWLALHEISPILHNAKAVIVFLLSGSLATIDLS